MTRDDLREDLFGNERRPAHVIHAELHVRALVIVVVQARDDVRNIVEAACHFGDHEVGVVGLGDCRNDVAVLDARLHQRILVVAYSLHGGTVEVAAKVVESLGLPIDNAHVVAVVGQH